MCAHTIVYYMLRRSKSACRWGALSLKIHKQRNPKETKDLFLQTQLGQTQHLRLPDKMETDGELGPNTNYKCRLPPKCIIIIITLLTNVE